MVPFDNTFLSKIRPTKELFWQLFFFFRKVIIDDQGLMALTTMIPVA